MDFFVILAVIAVAVVVIALWRRRSRNRDPLIRDPKIGFLNLLGEEGERFLEADRPALAPLFAESRESKELPPPVCDVLLVYSDLGRDGYLFATDNVGLRQLLRKSRARILIVATENNSESCIAAAQEAGNSGANLVLTLARNGAEFPEAFARLFGEMKSGATMPDAWGRVAPQGKIFLAEVGELRFAS